MNRNVESHFAMLPSANISRSRFDRSFDHKTTFNVGELIPFFVDTTVMPGDTYDITTSKVVRLQTLLTPVMDNLYLDVYWFFTPYRLLHTHWREIMGENRASAWLPEVEYQVPQIKGSISLGGSDDTPANQGDLIRKGSIFDHMGIPVSTDQFDDLETETNWNHQVEFMAYPYRAYCMIFNEWFRDENLTDPVNWSDGDADQYISAIRGGTAGDYGDGDMPFKVAKFHDYFTSALPSAQKGPPVSVPAGFSTNVSGIGAVPGWPVLPYGTNVSGSTSYLETLADNDASQDFFNTALVWRNIANNDPVYDNAGVVRQTKRASTSGQVYIGGNSEISLFPSNLFAAPSSNQASGLSVLVNDLRYAFQLQKLYERDARGGTRYIELIRSHFGVNSPDARMQRPEYLGGNRIPISIHQITNQSQGEQDFLGDLGAMSLTTDKHHDMVKSFTEHGVLLGLMCARYDHSYPQGLNRMWSMKSRFDFYWPVFASLGEQATLRKEICLTGMDSDDDVFGFQERWAEYRYMPNLVSGEMRPGIDNTLDSWHFADYYTSPPTFSDSWIREDKNNVDRTLAVTSAVADQIFCDVYTRAYVTRPMPLYSIPGLIDHH